MCDIHAKVGKIKCWKVPNSHEIHLQKCCAPTNAIKMYIRMPSFEKFLRGVYGILAEHDSQPSTITLSRLGYAMRQIIDYIRVYDYMSRYPAEFNQLLRDVVVDQKSGKLNNVVKDLICACLYIEQHNN